MKQFLVMCAVLPLLVIIMIQSTMDQVSAYKISAVNQVVYAASEQAKQAGCFTQTISNNLYNRLIELGFDSGDISLDLDSNLHNRGELIHYSVSVRMKNAMVKAMTEDNSYDYVIDSYTSSEYLDMT
ncbi:MAG: hypothetical protein Q4F55_04345 [Bacillota bacterium]|nr:hypothetical protein [Bacillota bacterium]